MNDPELDAMSRIADVLTPLERGARERVLTWAAQRFEVEGRAQVTTLPGRQRPSPDSRFDDVADLFDAVDPRTEDEKVLTVGYWFQAVQGADSVEGAQINTALKALGHGVSNVTRSFDRLMARHPRLAMQLQKSGRSKQARKKYKLTLEGIRRVERMIAGEGDERADE
jgi:hypothetical protein